MTSSNDQTSRSDRPNVVFIVGDNVGWGDIELLRRHLIDDPVEEWDLIEKRLDCAWVLEPVAQRLGALQPSMAATPTSRRVRSSPVPVTPEGGERRTAAALTVAVRGT